MIGGWQKLIGLVARQITGVACEKPQRVGWAEIRIGRHHVMAADGLGLRVPRCLSVFERWYGYPSLTDNRESVAMTDRARRGGRREGGRRRLPQNTLSPHLSQVAPGNEGPDHEPNGPAVPVTVSIRRPFNQSCLVPLRKFPHSLSILVKRFGDCREVKVDT